MPYKDETIYYFSHDGIARLWEKITQARRARMIFSHKPNGLALLVRDVQGVPLPVVMGTRLRYVSSFPYMFL